ncbi:MAG: thiamine diphosphokinase [Actinomycetia bacterium]|nr:thiamine diphosphokinase [Actinomycetes bacterium]
MTDAPFRRALVVCALANDCDQEDPRAYDLTMAVDGGVAWFRARGTAPDLFLGDGDSASESDQRWARAVGAEFQLVSSDKDYTDFDLALEVCERRGVTEALVIGALGGRVDQQLGVFGSLSRHGALRTVLHDARQFVTPVFAGQEYHCTQAVKTFGVVALSPAIVTVRNARWPLVSAQLEPLSTWGVSNEPQGGQPEVKVSEGEVLFIGQLAQ